jgi:thermolabile hemolysin
MDLRRSICENDFGVGMRKTTARGRILRIAVLLAVLPACTLISREPRPDPTARRQGPWQVRCSWVVESRPGGEEPAAGREWATDGEGRLILVEGSLEDGFVRVDRLHPEGDGAPLAASLQTVTELCREKVRRSDGGDAAELDSIAAVREDEDIELTLAFPDEAQKPGFSRLVIFGDSLSDPGNLERRLLVFPGAPYWQGRFTNGPNWSDWVVRGTDLAVQNHAYGGAVAIPHDDVPATSVIAAVEQEGQYFVSGSVDRQVDDYIAEDLAGGRVERPWETVFVLWAGANDYLSKEPFSGDITTLLDSPRAEAGYERVVRETVAAIASQVRRLYGAGARAFVVINLPDLGRTPIVLHNTSYRAEGEGSEEARQIQLSRKLSALTTYHNEQLAQAMRALAAELPSATINVFDARRALERMMQRTTEAQGGFDYGFDFPPLQRSVRDGRQTLHLQDRCYSGGYLGSDDPSQTCAVASRALFWNAVHPSSFTNCWIAWFIRDDMARAGQLAAPPPPQEYRAFCEAALP